MRQLSDASCKGCNLLLGEIAKYIAAGRGLEKPAWLVESARINSQVEPLWTVILNIHQPPQTLRAENGVVIDTMHDSRFSILLTLRFDGSWHVSELQKVVG